MNARRDDVDAERIAAKRRLSEEHGRCPNCGAAADVDTIDVTERVGAAPMFFAGTIRCSARCYEHDLDAYLAAIRAPK